MRLLLILKVQRLNGLQFHPLLGNNFLVDNNCANNLSKSSLMLANFIILEMRRTFEFCGMQFHPKFANRNIVFTYLNKAFM